MNSNPVRQSFTSTRQVHCRSVCRHATLLPTKPDEKNGCDHTGNDVCTRRDDVEHSSPEVPFSPKKGGGDFML